MGAVSPASAGPGTPRPLGFFVLGTALFLYAYVGCADTVTDVIGTGYSLPVLLLYRMTTVLAAIAAEALLSARPWCVQASAAAGAALLLMLAATATRWPSKGDVGVFLAAAAALLLVMVYVRDRAWKVGAVPAPRP